MVDLLHKHYTQIQEKLASDLEKIATEESNLLKTVNHATQESHRQEQRTA